MEDMKVHIQHVMREFKNDENSSVTAKTFAVFIAKVSLLTAKSKTGF